MKKKHSSLGQNLLYAYLAQFAAYVFPLVTLPYLSRILGPEAFGHLAVAQSLGLYLQALMEYGFSLSATREVAKHRYDQQRLSAILAGVFGARLLLLIPASLLTLLFQQVLPSLREVPALGLATLFQAAATAFTPSWFYRGLERMKEVALMELTIRLAALVALLLWVKTPQHVHLVPLLNGLASSMVGLVGFFHLGLALGFRLPSLPLAWLYLRKGARLLPFLLVNATNLTINPLVLSLFSSSVDVGQFTAADRLVRSFWNVLDPIGRTFFPRLTYLVASDEQRARSFAFRISLLMGIIGLGMALIIFSFAPWLVRLIFGETYQDTVALTRIMIWMLPLGALANAWGVQWTLALGLDILFNRIMALSALTQATLAVVLASTYGPLGVAWGAVLTSLLETTSLALVLSRLGKLPLWRKS